MERPIQGSRSLAPAFVLALAVTLIDGFDSMTLSLTAPALGKSLHLPTAALGFIFSTQSAGMMLGAALGGYLADRVGRLPSLIGYLVTFSLAAFGMQWMDTAWLIAANRLVAGLALGAAAPVIVAVIAPQLPPSRTSFSVGAIWAGMPAGGILAALFNYSLVPKLGWISLFVAGGFLPLLVAGLVVPVLKPWAKSTRTDASATGIRGLIRAVGYPRLLSLMLLFLFGYAGMAIIVFWLPTFLSFRDASPLLVALAFSGANLGSSVGSAGFGFLSDRIGQRRALVTALLLASVMLGFMEWPALTPLSFFAFATIGSAATAGAIALLVSMASRLQPENASTAIGTMVTVGRLGQVAALAASGFIGRLSEHATGVFLLAAGLALLSAVIAGLRGSVPRGARGGIAAQG